MLLYTIPQSDDQLFIVTDRAVRCSGLGATMYARRGHQLLLAGFFAARLKKNQSIWLPCEMEALSIAVAIRHFSPYIIMTRHQACIVTDSQPCVQAFEKLRREEFSATTRVTTFLSAAS